MVPKKWSEEIPFAGLWPLKYCRYSFILAFPNPVFWFFLPQFWAYSARPVSLRAQRQSDAAQATARSGNRAVEPKRSLRSLLCHSSKHKGEPKMMQVAERAHRHENSLEGLCVPTIIIVIWPSAEPPAFARSSEAQLWSSMMATPSEDVEMQDITQEELDRKPWWVQLLAFLKYLAEPSKEIRRV